MTSSIIIFPHHVKEDGLEGETGALSSTPFLLREDKQEAAKGTQEKGRRADALVQLVGSGRLRSRRVLCLRWVPGLKHT